MSRTVQGKAFTWEISDAPIGSGDAGEVFAVSCVERPEQRGVMKKPAQIATGGTIQRQAGQIAQEALALQMLDGLPRGKAHPPRLLDEAPEFTRGTANYFIISETAPGEDLESMLASARKAGKPFPRRVIITVLDALFDLFSRAHKANILWNDVKLDHIYWHNPTGQVGVIDWGNALFLNQDPAEGLYTPPRWEDYRQMVTSLGGFLKQNAPELYDDLGWDEFQIPELDASRVSVLARRIAYQQQVIALRVMEYQALLRVVLQDDPVLEGLHKIQTYQNALEQIGAPWDTQGVLRYARHLVTQSLANGERQAAVNATLLTWELFDDQLDLPWHLLREYFRNVEILAHASLEKLVAFTLNNQWLDALWTLTVIAQDQSTEHPAWWHRLMPILRQKAFGMNTPLPYQTCQRLLEWSATQGSGGAQHTADLTKTLGSWHTKGSKLKKSPLDYQLLDWLQKGVDLPIRLRSEVKKSFAAGEEPVRELMGAWRNADWDAFPKAFQKVIAWDPDRWGVIPLAQLMESFIQWLGDLHTGPNSQEDLKQTVQNFIDQRPGVEAFMGTPPWLSALVDMLEAIHLGEPIANYREKVKNWCPWLLTVSNINETQQQYRAADEGATTAAIIHFEGHLKSWSDLETGFHLLASTAPSYETFCRHLIAAFTSALSLNFDPALVDSLCKDIPHPEFARSCEVLHLIINWRKKIVDHDLAGALQVMIDHPLPDWRLLDYVHRATQDWVESVFPALAVLKSFTPLTVPNKPKGTNEALAEVCVSCLHLHQTWAMLEDSGLHLPFLEKMEETIEQMRAGFFTWRNGYEHTDDRVSRLLYHSQLTLIREISGNLLRLSQHIRQAKLGYALIDKDDQVALASQMRAAENILGHLSAVESILIDNNKDWQFPRWQQLLRQMIDSQHAQDRQQLILTLPKNHPLYAWLVQSTLAY